MLKSIIKFINSSKNKLKREKKKKRIHFKPYQTQNVIYTYIVNI